MKGKLVLSLILILLIGAAVPALAFVRTMTVTGDADSRVKPDRAIVTVGRKSKRKKRDRRRKKAARLHRNL